MGSRTNIEALGTNGQGLVCCRVIETLGTKDQGSMHSSGTWVKMVKDRAVKSLIRNLY